MTSEMRAKLACSVTPVGVIAVCAIATAFILGVDVALKAAAIVLILFVLKQAAEPLQTLWWNKDDDEEDPPAPQHGVPTGQPYAPTVH